MKPPPGSTSIVLRRSKLGWSSLEFTAKIIAEASLTVRETERECSSVEKGRDEKMGIKGGRSFGIFQGILAESERFHRANGIISGAPSSFRSPMLYIRYHVRLFYLGLIKRSWQDTAGFRVERMESFGLLARVINLFLPGSSTHLSHPWNSRLANSHIPRVRIKSVSLLPCLRAVRSHSSAL